MSDTDDSSTGIEEFDAVSDTGSLSERMASFRDEHATSTPLEELRREAARGAPLSETVIEGRDERIE